MKLRRVKDRRFNECDLYILDIYDIIRLNQIQIDKFISWEHHLYKDIKKSGILPRVRKSKIIERVIIGVVKKFFTILSDELIDNNSIFVFPKNKMALAIAQRKSDSRYYNYLTKYETGCLECYLVLNPVFFRCIKKNYIVILPDYMIKKIMKNVRAGKKYITYEQMMNQLDYNY